MKKLLTLPTMLILTGCGVDSDSVRKQASAEAAGSIPNVPMTWKTAQAKTGRVNVAWVRRFNDSTLNRLVREAQANNKDLQVAAANVTRSQALARQAGAVLSPQVNLTAGGGRSGSGLGRAPANVNLGLQASWEIDLWGRLKSSRQAAKENAAAALANYRYSQESLAAGVARAYFLAIDAQRQEALNKRTLVALREIQRIVKAQKANGEASGRDLSLVNSDIAGARAGVVAAQGSKRDAVRALELLLGRYPGNDLKVRSSLPSVPRVPKAGIPSQLLERRPDLIAAERQIAATINGVNEAKAARLPSIKLSGSYGGSSSALNKLTNPGNLAWQAASSLLVPLTDGGARKEQIKVSKASQKAAVASYASAALKAFGEVEQALDQGLLLRQRAKLIKISLDESNNALRLAELSHKAGETDLLDVLNLRQKVATLEASYITLQRARLDQIVALNLALGGSWK